MMVIEPQGRVHASRQRWWTHRIGTLGKANGACINLGSLTLDIGAGGASNTRRYSKDAPTVHPVKGKEVLI